MSVSFDSVRDREAKHFLPVVNRLPVAIASGSGSIVKDVDGKEYIDLTAGWGVTAIGHCHPALVDAVSQQAGTLMQTTNLFYTLPQLDLIEKLDAITPAEITRTFMTNSGTEAIEGAIKLSHRATGRSKFIAAENSFHGRTLGALSLIGQDKHRAPFEPLLNKTTIVPFGDLDAARAAIDGDTAAFIIEPVQGEGGVNVPPAGYMAGVAEACRENGALFVLDEIQTGIGRTGTWLALEHEGVVPDVLTLGKGLGGGFPVAAFMCTEAVGQTAAPGEHGGTYIGNPVAAAAANAVLRVMEEDKLVENAARLGTLLDQKLADFASAHPELATGTRGRGLLRALILADAERAGALPLRAVERGVLVNVTAGNVMRFFPALNIPDAELFEALDRLFDLIRNP